MRHNIYLTSFLLGLTVLIFTGCSNPDAGLIRVDGVITHNGEAVEGAAISFEATDDSGNAGIGVTDASGRYTLTIQGAVNTGSGVPPGNYIVLVRKREQSDAADPDQEAYSRGEIDYDTLQQRRAASGGAASFGGTVTDLLPSRYGRMATSPLRATVSAESRTHNFDLTGR